MNNILIKFPSRQRPEIFRTALSKYINMSENKENIFYLFSLDSDDQTLNNYIQIINEYLPKKNFKIDIGTSTSKIHAVNRGLNEFINENIFKIDIILLASDDMWPCVTGYDNIIRQNAVNDSYLWFYDGHQDRINTLSIMDIEYYKRFNYIYQTDYKSFFCDNEQTEVALNLNKCIKINKCIIRHEHPMCANTQIKNDDLYKKNNIYWDHDKELYNTRRNNRYA